MKKVLLVDDEPDVLEILSKRLSSEGYAVDTAADGVQGMEKLQSATPDIVLLDVTMPNKDGFSLLAEMQADQAMRRIPVVMLTAKAATGDIFRGQQLGAIDYLIKPVDFQDILKYVRRYT